MVLQKAVARIRTLTSTPEYEYGKQLPSWNKCKHKNITCMRYILRFEN